MAVAFGDIDQKITRSGAYLGITSPWTVGGWAKQGSTTPDSGFFRTYYQYGDTDSTNAYIYLGPITTGDNHIALEVFDGTNTFDTSLYSPVVDTYFYWALRYDGVGTLDLIIDGSVFASLSIDLSTVVFIETDERIGGNWADFTFANIGVFQSALTLANITAQSAVAYPLFTSLAFTPMFPGGPRRTGGFSLFQLPDVLNDILGRSSVAWTLTGTLPFPMFTGTIIYSDDFSEGPDALSAEWQTYGSLVAPNATVHSGGCSSFSFACSGGAGRQVFPNLTGALSVRLQIGAAIGSAVVLPGGVATIAGITFNGSVSSSGYVLVLQMFGDGTLGIGDNSQDAPTRSAVGSVPVDGSWFALQWRLTQTDTQHWRHRVEVDDVTVLDITQALSFTVPAVVANALVLNAVNIANVNPLVDVLVGFAAIEVDSSDGHVTWLPCGASPDTVGLLCDFVPPTPTVTGLSMSCTANQVTVTGSGFTDATSIALTGPAGQVLTFTFASRSSTQLVLDVTGFALATGTYCVALDEIASYVLTVTSGSGSGIYAAGQVVPIVANSAPGGEQFSVWTGATVADPAASSTTLTMPIADTVVTATYIAIPMFVLTVSSGSGSGSYAAGASVPIIASAPPSGQVFSRWNGSAAIVNPFAASTTILMPATAVSITAAYVAVPVFYTLTVTAGTGGGSYLPGTTVPIVAGTPPAGQAFAGWTGATVANPALVSTTILMPAANTTVVATYVTVPVFYPLTVVSGSGSGSYTADTVVPLVAATAPVGQAFSRWTGAAVANQFAASTTLTMPASAATVTATYVTLPVFYHLAVTSGSGTGNYLAGTVVTIAAASPPSGQTFVRWLGATVADPFATTTTITMPAADSAVTASYVPLPTFTLTVTSGTGSGVYLAGAAVSIVANAPPAGQTFLQWTGATVTAQLPSTTLVMPASNTAVTATYTATPTFYASLSGNDANPGTIGSPFRTLNGAGPHLFPGAQLLMRGGTYNESVLNSQSHTVIPGGTSWGNKVRIAAYPGETVWLRPTTGGISAVIWLVTDTSKYIEFDGINLDASGLTDIAGLVTGGIDPATQMAHHIRIKNAEIIRATTSSGCLSGGCPETDGILFGAHEVENTIGHNEALNVKIHGGNGAFGYGIYLSGPNNLVDVFDIYDTSSAGIQIYNGGGDSADNNIVRNGRVHDLTTSGQGRGWGILVSGNNNQIYNNLIDHLTIPGPSNNAGIYVYTGSGNQIYDNTVANNAHTGIWIDGGAASTDIKNNITYLNAEGDYVNGGTGTTQSNNMISGVNPLFVNASAQDYNLQGGSPAHGAGVGIAFIATDILGRARPTSGACDIGAYETP